MTREQAFHQVLAVLYPPGSFVPLDPGDTVSEVTRKTRALAEQYVDVLAALGLLKLDDRCPCCGVGPRRAPLFSSCSTASRIYGDRPGRAEFT